MSEPNTWAKATVKNDWGSTISRVELHHRYDHDHFDDNAWTSIAPGATGGSFDIGYWTGFLRTGYSSGSRLMAGAGAARATSIASHRDDAGGTVVCRVYKDVRERPLLDSIGPAP